MKRLWLISLIPPLAPAASYAAYFASDGAAVATLGPLIFIYLLVPALDGVVGPDPRNAPPAVLDEISKDPFYRRLLYVGGALLYASFFLTVWFVSAQSLPVWAYLALAFGVGLIHGDAMNIGHELGHKASRADRMAAQMVTGLIGYGHFCIEHNRGHHIQVATPEDPASARMGESVYAFALRELPGALRRGWRCEAGRLKRKGLPTASAHNEILQSYALTLAVIAAATLIAGWLILPFILIHHFAAWYALTNANYVEHYGLLREARADGRYEPTAPRHSWNTNHLVSNLLLFQLQRHSDHHAHPARPYQALRHDPSAPQLPSGYPGCYALAAFPPLWFRVMDPKVIAWAGGDLDRANVAPRSRARLERRYAAARR